MKQEETRVELQGERKGGDKKKKREGRKAVTRRLGDETRASSHRK